MLLLLLLLLLLLWPTTFALPMVGRLGAHTRHRYSCVRACLPCAVPTCHHAPPRFMSHNMFLTNALKAFEENDKDHDNALSFAEMTQMKEYVGENDPILQHILASAHEHEL